MLSVDWTTMINSIFAYASSVVSALLPLVGITAGFTLGFRLVEKVGGMFSRAI